MSRCYVTKQALKRASLSSMHLKNKQYTTERVVVGLVFSFVPFLFLFPFSVLSALTHYMKYSQKGATKGAEMLALFFLSPIKKILRLCE